MKLHLIESDKIYREILATPIEKRNEIFKKSIILPFIKKFEKQHISIDEDAPFNVMTLLSFMHKMPEDFVKEDISFINRFDKNFWQTISEAFYLSLKAFTSKGITLPINDYYLTALLGDPNSQMMSIYKNYSGDGGIPGYIILSIVPNDYTINRIPSAVAHECNHNIRYQFIEWGKGPLKEMIISEGLAENFAEKMYGKTNIGPWVTENSLYTLNKVIKPIIKENLSINNMQEAMPYLYGNEITKMQGGKGIGLPYASGYTCGYYIIKYYLQKTGFSIEEATLKTADEILNEVNDFWDQTTI